MLSSLTTKLALKKAGIPSDILDLPNQLTAQPQRTPNKLRKNPPSQTEDESQGWGSWMSIRSLPLTVQPWLNPPPPAVAVARVPGIGDKAPDKDPRLALGQGKRVLLVFLRCVGCAFAQKTFINLRTMANRYGDALTCIAVSHASEQATQKWVSLLGGAWSVRVVVDEDRALYAAWGLGTGGMWYLFNPTTQVQGWKETGWLGEKVAGAIQKKGIEEKSPKTAKGANGDGDDQDDEGPLTVMGNKWQEAGAFAIDGTGTVIWGGKAMRADDVMELEDGARILLA
ncbi:tsa antioxidant enzyme [Fusarium albosuccineum]|uniref:Tsa antioxidant enzyme n=1 Tax=Fusarium albosuccineum TaxID=1237068 RepID=A0A8H4P6I4_9HYPO|nr:tsa antioxidant enzyme [Fusarium albosuccineum]